MRGKGGSVKLVGVGGRGGGQTIIPLFSQDLPCDNFVYTWRRPKEIYTTASQIKPLFYSTPQGKI